MVGAMREHGTCVAARSLFIHDSGHEPKATRICNSEEKPRERREQTAQQFAAEPLMRP